MAPHFLIAPHFFNCTTRRIILVTFLRKWLQLWSWMKRTWFRGWWGWCRRGIVIQFVPFEQVCEWVGVPSRVFTFVIKCHGLQNTSTHVCLFSHKRITTMTRCKCLTWQTIFIETISCVAPHHTSHTTHHTPNVCNVETALTPVCDDTSSTAPVYFRTNQQIRHCCKWPSKHL